MITTDPAITVTLRLSRDVYNRVTRTATEERQSVEDLLSTIIPEGLDAHSGVRELFNQISEQYRLRLEHEGKADQTRDEVLEELRVIREQVARELYP